MCADPKSLYRNVILEHSKTPSRFGALDNPTHSAVGNNPLCGDQITIQATVVDDELADLGFSGHGCAITVASASMMMDELYGKPSAEADRLATQVLVALDDQNDETDLGAMEALKGVREFPSRIKCATLPWNTLIAALKDSGATVTTE